MAVCCVLPRYLLPQRQNVKYFRLVSIIQTLVAFLCLCKQSDCKLEEKLIEVSISDDCICPGNTVTYECTIVGDYGGFTVWMGEFIQCPNGKTAIELLHSPEGGEASNARICNNGDIAIVGRIIRVENGTFTSQLNITLTSAITGERIECAYDNGTSIRRVGTLNIATELIATKLQVENISWVTTSCSPSDIYFNWDALPLDCPSTRTYYNIRSNCGSCPTTTNHTTVTCIGVPTNGSMCKFSVQSAMCNRKLLNITMIPRCTGENDLKLLLLAVILPLTILLFLLAVLVPLSLYIIKKKSLTLTGLCCRKALYRNGLHKEQETEKCSRKSHADEDTNEATEIFDIKLNEIYNIAELDIIQSEQMQESMQGKSGGVMILAVVL